MKHLVLVIFLSAVAILRADTIVVTGYGGTSSDECYGGCSPFTISLPQFDPSLGTLTSITWAFTDNQQFYGGYNDMYDPLLGDPFTWTTTEGDAADLLGLDASNSQFNSGMTCGCRQISMGGWLDSDLIQASGTVPDDNPFVGTGVLNIPITPFVGASVPTSSNGWVEAGIVATEDSATLTITDTYTTTPEPRATTAVLAAAFLLVVVRLNANRPLGHVKTDPTQI